MDLMVESDSLRSRRVSTRDSTSEGRSLSKVISPKGVDSKCFWHRLTYNSLVEGLRSDAANVVARQWASQWPRVLEESLGGPPLSMRWAAALSLAATSFRVLP